MGDKKNEAVALLKAIVFILAGVILLLRPSLTLRAAAMVFGAGVLAYGIFTAVSQLMARDEKQPAALTAGLIAVVAGVVVLLAPQLVVELFPVLAGILVILGGVKRCTDALVARSDGDRGWPLGMLLAVVCIVLGVLVILNPFGTAVNVVQLIGIAGIYYGVTALVRLLR